MKKLRPRSYTIVSGAGLDKMKHSLRSQVHRYIISSLLCYSDLRIYVFSYLSINLSIKLSVQGSIYPSIYLSTYLSIFPSRFVYSCIYIQLKMRLMSWNISQSSRFKCLLIIIHTLILSHPLHPSLFSSFFLSLSFFLSFFPPLSLPLSASFPLFLSLSMSHFPQPLTPFYIFLGYLCAITCWCGT